jgi:hypothetical protein
MAARKKKAASKPARRPTAAKAKQPAATVKSKPPAKRKAAPARETSKSATPPKKSKTAARPSKVADAIPFDLSSFPPESIRTFEKWLCLACVADVFTRLLDLNPRTAHLEIRRYTPSIAELYAHTIARPWFVNEPRQEHCPYCGSASKWHTRLWVYRIESGKATDALRREMVKQLPQSGQFAVLEEKATQQHAFFEWLEQISSTLNLDDPVWLRDVSLHYLSRKEPKTDWQEQFTHIHSIRRSRRLESGWEVDAGRLFLAPHLFDELILVQYLVSRSHKAGGLTLEGRYTLPELFTRLRNSGYLRAVGVHTQNSGDAFEQLVEYLGGGEAAIKFYHIVDRREFLEKMKSLKEVKPPKPKAR